MIGESPTPGVCVAVLMPHAPVLVPAVGGMRCTEVAGTVAAMRRAARECLAAAAEALVLVSPHSPRRRDGFGLWDGARVSGDLGHFGASRAAVDLPVDPILREAIEDEAAARLLTTWRIPGEDMDHGAVVPLCFLREAGWRGPTVVLGLGSPRAGGEAELGAAIAAAARQARRRVAFVASGDMSHRLLPGAPCGYHPGARDFDELFIATLRAGDDARLAALDPELLERAAEDAVDSTVMALAACGWRRDGREVLSYEGPFGVGYGVAILYREQAAGAGQAGVGEDRRELPEEDAEEVPPWLAGLPALARRSVASALAGGSAAPGLPVDQPLAGLRAGVFVTLRTRAGELRGCIGTVEPQGGDVVEETWSNARAAALRDRRFRPVTARELPELLFEVSVLGAPEDVVDEEQLDPRVDGVIVAGSGGRRGLLLPDIGGIDTPRLQVEVACRKAGIDPGEPVRLQRFRTIKVSEAEGDEGA